MIKKVIEYTITVPDQGCSVESFLRSRGYSHRLVVRLRNDPGGLTVDGRTVYTIHSLAAGELLRVTLTEEESSNIVPARLPLSIVYEDEDLLVINKAAGVAIHPSPGHHHNSLANAVAWYYSQKGEPFTYRAINRLDRDTTGLLILAKHMLSACVLSGKMLHREIRREYRALACGRTMEQGVIHTPIARVPGSVLERQVDEEKGEAACTRYRRLSYNEALDLSYISLCLETGRTHQIRVHMKSIGHPLPGDFLYHPDYRYISRQPLHSHRLGFCHPVTGQAMDFTSELPEDMACLVNGNAAHIHLKPLG